MLETRQVQPRSHRGKRQLKRALRSVSDVLYEQRQYEQGAHGRRIVRPSTRIERERTLCLAVRELHGLGYTIEDVRRWRLKHTRALYAHWRACGRSRGYIDKRLSALRTLAQFCGRADVVPPRPVLAQDWEQAQGEPTCPALL